MTAVEEVFNAALSLPPDNRAALAEKLLDSLPEEDQEALAAIETVGASLGQMLARSRERLSRLRREGLPSGFRPRLYQGRFGSAQFQSIYQPFLTWWFQIFTTAECCRSHLP